MSSLPIPFRRAVSMTYSSLRYNDRVSLAAGHKNEYDAKPASCPSSHAKRA